MFQVTNSAARTVVSTHATSAEAFAARAALIAKMPLLRLVLGVKKV